MQGSILYLAKMYLSTQAWINLPLLQWRKHLRNNLFQLDSSNRKLLFSEKMMRYMEKQQQLWEQVKNLMALLWPIALIGEILIRLTQILPQNLEIMLEQKSSMQKIGNSEISNHKCQLVVRQPNRKILISLTIIRLQGRLPSELLPTGLIKQLAQN